MTLRLPMTGALRLSRCAVLAPLLWGCGPKLDPLVDLRIERTTWPAASTAPANATALVGTALGERIVREWVQDLPLTSPPGPFGLRLVILPSVHDATVSFSGASPVQVGLDVEGTVDLRTGFGGADDMPWQARIDGDVDLSTLARPGGLELALALPDPDALSVAVTLDGLQGDAGVAAGGMASGAIEQAITQALATPMGARLPPGLGMPRDIRPRGVQSGLALDLVLPAIGPTPTTLPEPPDPGDGFVVELHEATVLAFARAVASAQRVTGLALLEPEAVDVTPDGIVLEGKVHRTARSARWRRYRTTLQLGTELGRLTATLNDLELLDRHGWSNGPAAAIAESSAPARVAAMASAIETVKVLPVDTSHQLELRVGRIELTDTSVRLWGNASIAPRTVP